MLFSYAKARRRNIFVIMISTPAKIMKSLLVAIVDSHVSWLRKLLWKNDILTWRSGYLSLVYFMRSIWKVEFPWDESSTITSTPACTRASILCLSSSRVPTAAPTRSCFFLSFDARGYSRFFLRSVCAISDTSSPLSLTMGSFAC